MAFTAADVKTLREMTSVGMMDCKKALVETDGDMDKAVEWLREKGLAKAAKKAGRIAAEGMSYALTENGVGALVEVNCETDFCAKSDLFVAFVKDIAKAVAENNPADVDALMNSKYPGSELTVSETMPEKVMSIGENLQIRRFVRFAENTSVGYVHAGGKIGVLVNLAVEGGIDATEIGKNIAMQIASASPVAIDESGVPQEVKDKEVEVAIEKTKAELVQKAVEAAIKKAGYNPAHFDSEDHMESNQTKGWITADDVAAVKKIIADVTAEKSANMNEAMIQNIAKGRLNKFLKESCLLSQEYIWDKNLTVEQYLKSIDSELTVIAMSRFTLSAE